MKPSVLRMRWVSASFASLLAPVTAQTEFSFNDVTAARGIGSYQFPDGIGAGAAASDFDNDGDIDIFVPNRRPIRDQLYRNLGNGSFEEIAVAAGLASIENNQAGLWFDFDGDHDLDLFVTNFNESAPSSYRLYRQDASAVFTDVTEAAGVSGGNGAHRGGSCAGDINNDGYLDLLTLPWGGEANLFLNNQDGTFTDISESSGVGDGVFAYWQPMMADLNGDGWQDIYVAVDVAENILWINQQDNTFVDVAAAAGADITYNDMGLTITDYDADGDLDLYTTNIFGAPCCPCCAVNALLRNDTVDGVAKFTEVSESAGVADTSWGWGVTFMDGDNDGLVDIAATNGFTDPPYSLDTSRFFRNLGGTPPVFANVSNNVGFSDAYWGSGLISLDADRDGDLDLFQTCAENLVRLMDNELVHGDQTHYLVVQPRMDGPNHFAIGATVHTQVGQTRQMRLISAGTSFMSQEPAEAWFGLGSTTLVDEVTVHWPDGSSSTVSDVCANQVIELYPADTKVAPYAVGLGVNGPASTQEGQSVSCTASASRCDGTSDDVTADAEWEVVEGGDFATLIGPGLVQIGDISENQLITLRAAYSGFEALWVVIAETVETPAGTDQPPLIAVLSPADSEIETEAGEIVISGSASDDIGLVSVVWSNDRGGLGPCVGMQQWETWPIGLLEGANVITITATDTAGQSAEVAVTVTRIVNLPPVEPPANGNANGNIAPNEPPVNSNLAPANENTPGNTAPPDVPNDNAFGDEPGPPTELPNGNENDNGPLTEGEPDPPRSRSGGCGILGMIEMSALFGLLMVTRMTGLRRPR